MTRTLLILFFFVNFSNAQGETTIWYFGENAGIKFTENTVEVLTDSQMNTFEGCATISNAEGELLFYTDGSNVWDRNHNLMPNGIDLSGNTSSSQSSIIVPRPNSSTIYYIFTSDAIEGANFGFRYSIVDLNLNNGNGDVTEEKNIQLLETTSIEKVSVVKHDNNEVFWITSISEDHMFYSFRLTDIGLDLNATISPVGFDLTEPNGTGYLKFSPNGEKLVCAFYGENSRIGIYDFNSLTGDIETPTFIDGLFNALGNNSGAYGIEFSPNQHYLYVSETPSIFNGSIVSQFDLSVDNIQDITDSRTIIYEGSDIIGAIQIGINGKLYLANIFNSFLDVIENPNEEGLGCGYINRALFLEDRISLAGLPSFIPSFFSTEDLDQASLFVPQGISPNDDGLNDNLDLIDGNVSSLKIFNRYGTLVYTKDNYTNEWIGQSNNGSLLPVGTYFLSFIYNNDQTHTSWIYLNK